jgi:restriction endonuclease S subunit
MVMSSGKQNLRSRAKSWITYRFDQMADNIAIRVDPAEAQDERYVGLEHLDPESLKIRRWGTAEDVIGTKLRFSAGDIIFGRRRAYQRKLAVADFNGICSAHALVLRARKDVVLPEFLPFFMQSDLFFNRAMEISVGSLSPTINWKTLAIQEFPLPPLDEQRRIAEILWAIEDTSEKFILLTSKVEEARLAVINESVNLKNKMGVLEDVCDKIVDGPHYPPEFILTGIPFLLVSNLSSGYIDWIVSKCISQEDYSDIYRRINCEVGDVLYTVVGSYGIPIYIDWEKPFAFQRHIALIKPNRQLLNGKYLTYYLQSDFAKKQATILAVGNAQKTITLGSLSKFPIPIISLAQQEDICCNIEYLDHSRKSIDDNLYNLIHLKKQVLGVLI